MSLHSVLIIIGAVLILVIYFVSKWSGKSGSASMRSEKGDGYEELRDNEEIDFLEEPVHENELFDLVHGLAVDSEPVVENEQAFDSENDQILDQDPNQLDDDIPVLDGHVSIEDNDSYHQEEPVERNPFEHVDESESSPIDDLVPQKDDQEESFDPIHGYSDDEEPEVLYELSLDDLEETDDSGEKSILKNQPTSGQSEDEIIDWDAIIDDAGDTSEEGAFSDSRGDGDDHLGHIGSEGDESESDNPDDEEDHIAAAMQDYPDSRIEPKFSEVVEVDTESQFTAPSEAVSKAVSEGGSNEFIYPDIPGFSKISQIDYWVKIHGDRDVGRESALAQYREVVSSFSKKNQIHGLKLPEGEWRDLGDVTEEARFGDLILTIQLADKIGAISNFELSQFTDLASKLSEGTGRDFTFMAPVASAQQQANAICDFINHYDSIFVANVKPVNVEYFEGGMISRCATQLGLERSEDNHFIRNKSMGKEKVCLYKLANLSDKGEFDFENLKNFKTRGVTFYTRLAVNRSPGAVFSEMVDTAKAFASRVKGVIEFPNYNELSQDDVDKIRQSIDNVAQEMESHGLPPGSDEAMRLF